MTTKRLSPKQKIAQQLNWLKAQILNQYHSEIRIAYQLETLGFIRDSYLRAAEEQTAKDRMASKLIRLQYVANRYNIKGNYLLKVPYEKTRQAKHAQKLAEQDYTALRQRQRKEYEEAKKDPAALAKIVNASFSEKKGT